MTMENETFWSNLCLGIEPQPPPLHFYSLMISALTGKFSWAGSLLMLFAMIACDCAWPTQGKVFVWQFWSLTGDEENIDRFNRRLVKVTKQHSEECRDLLKLMGVPYVEVIVAASATLDQTPA